ncbi:MAG: phosphate ABC transporter permease PstA [Vallitaleaceae bacterium]|nr:phosphate ABC transporter permease PstA [Vallitaleaceae bacterium]
MITLAILLSIISFVFVKGIPKIDLHFLTSSYDNVTQYVQMTPMENSKTNQLGVQLAKVTKDKETYFEITGFDDGSKSSIGTVKKVSADQKSIIEESYPIKKGMYIEGIGSEKIVDLSVEEAYTYINEQTASSIRVKFVEVGGGIIPMLVTTLYMIGLSLVVALPIGIFAAIYLVEYAKAGRLVRIIRFGTESLAGIPSIIYGLFGMLFFVTYLKLGYSILAGALTVSIILLPVIIRQTEEALKAVPMSYREGSLGLGVTKLQTIRRVVLPSAVPGILVAVILSVGRIVGESAALFLTAGTVARIPNSLFVSGSTLTVKAYQVAKEEGNIEMACAIGTIIIVLVVLINMSSKYVSKHFSSKI